MSGLTGFRIDALSNSRTIKLKYNKNIWRIFMYICVMLYFKVLVSTKILGHLCRNTKLLTSLFT